MELHVDPVTSSCRAVLAFCRAADLAPEVKTVTLAKGDNRAPSHAALNPNLLVPVLVDGDFVLTESSAILRYLARKSGSPLYPNDLREAAKVDELMAWFGATFNKDFAYQYLYPQVLPQYRRASEDANRITIEWGAAQTRRWLDVLDRHWLGAARSHLVGERLTIADYLGAALLSGGELVGCTYREWPNVRRWYAAMLADEALATVNRPFLAMVESIRASGRTFVPLLTSTA